MLAEGLRIALCGALTKTVEPGVRAVLGPQELSDSVGSLCIPDFSVIDEPLLVDVLNGCRNLQYLSVAVRTVVGMTKLLPGAGLPSLRYVRLSTLRQTHSSEDIIALLQLMPGIKHCDALPTCVDLGDVSTYVSRAATPDAHLESLALSRHSPSVLLPLLLSSRWTTHKVFLITSTEVVTCLTRVDWESTGTLDVSRLHIIVLEPLASYANNLLSFIAACRSLRHLVVDGQDRDVLQLLRLLHSTPDLQLRTIALDFSTVDARAVAKLADLLRPMPTIIPSLRSLEVTCIDSVYPQYIRILEGLRAPFYARRVKLLLKTRY
ncbi:hypothetical protein AURDEDRAFT_166175 [Auricularia subglabra TFB-10046 SS5]|nr:hypothetical protein AURDEDRAFT_166175 [Auricularia subglabra TFB-10046 SS5]